MTKDVMTKAQARKVLIKLRVANQQVYKSAESIGVDYYGLTRWYKEEEKFWSDQLKLISLAAERIKKRYNISY